MENSFSFSMGIAITIVMLAGGYMFFKNHNKTKRKSAEVENRYKIQIKTKIDEIEKKFTSQAIGYYLQEQTFEMGISKKDREELLQSLGYEAEFSSPIIDWINEFNFMKRNINERDDFIKEYLINEAGKDFCNDGEFVLNCFERHLLLQAKVETDRLISMSKARKAY